MHLLFFRTAPSPRAPAFALSFLLALIAATAAAAPEEIQVYMDEMNAPGEFGLDIHGNDVFSGRAYPQYPGEQPPAHVLRLTPEFSYGLTQSLELGAYVLSTRDATGYSAVDGEKLRVKYIATHAEDQVWFWGANLEIGRVAQRRDDNPWNGELKGILGYHGERWTVAVNSNIDFKVHGPAPSPAMLDLETKVSYKTDGGIGVGVESYNDLGQLSRLGGLGRQSESLFAVLDASIHGWEVNLGVGRGLTPASDRWLLKTIVGVPFH